jgi:ubiquinone/menaquinone biosynthesis C-methylase UbiE
MNELISSKQAWENFARDDPLWAVLTDAKMAGQKWDENAFFETGRREIGVVFHHLDSIGISPTAGVALDFGCGVGRLTQALAEHFSKVHGVDISETMIAEARRLGQRSAGCQFHVNSAPDLQLFPDSTFDFIYSSIVLQHVPVRYVKLYLQEFVRVLKPKGILVFQIPDQFRSNTEQQLPAWQKLRRKLRLRTRLNSWFFHKEAAEMQMNAVAESKVRRLIERAGARVVDVQLTNSTDAAFNGNLRFLEAEPLEGWVSKQYCVVK